MPFHHICVMVSDLNRSLPFYQGLLGFKNTVYDGTQPGTWFDGKTLDDILGTRNAATRIALVTDDSGAMLELQQAANPRTTKTPDEYLRYGATGIRELGLAVSDIDDLFQRVKAAGVKTQTDYIWSPLPGTRSFLFYDPDGALIQAVSESNLRTRGDATMGNVEIAEALFEAIAGRNDRGVRSLCASNVRTRQNNGAEMDLEAFLALSNAVQAVVRDFRYADAVRSATATGFVEEHAVRGTLPDGQTIDIAACVVADVRDGKITDIREYLDTAAAANLIAALGSTKERPKK
jgi:catechol 2,3-dioxygenase-like lactoylglutathione lyase family enzyme/ketosteroid isomerase-like protein